MHGCDVIVDLVTMESFWKWVRVCAYTMHDCDVIVDSACIDRMHYGYGISMDIVTMVV